jgi:hypothetical protein
MCSWLGNRHIFVGINPLIKEVVHIFITEVFYENFTENAVYSDGAGNRIPGFLCQYGKVYAAFVR